MRILLISLFLLIFSFYCYSQASYGIIKKQANLREYAFANAKVIKKLKPQTLLFYFSEDTIGSYTKVWVIKTAQIGYVKSNVIKFTGKVKESSSSPFVEEQADSSNTKPDLRIFNNTKHTMTLSLNNNNYTLTPFEKIKIPFDAGLCKFVASAPGVIPLFGKKEFLIGHYYNWEFYIVITYR